MNGDIVDALGLEDPDRVLPSRNRRQVAQALPTAAPLVEPPANAENPFAKWPDGHIHGMFECAPQRAAFFVEGRLLAGRAHVLAGVGGSSKTRAQYQLAIGAVLGRIAWDWQIERTGSAALFLTEDTFDDVHRVLHAIGATLNEEERKKLTTHLRVYQLAGRPARLLHLSGQSLIESDVYEWLMLQLDKMPKPIAYIGIDPALGVTEGDEMNPAHQRRLGELVDRIAIMSGACVVLTTHAAKSLHAADELGSHSSRGSGAITDAVRGELVLRSMTADEARKFGIDDIVERKRHVQLACTKGNSMPPEAFAPIWLRRGEAGLLSGVTLEQVERGSIGNRELQALEILKVANVTGETSLKFWQEQCDAAGLLPKTAADATKKKAMQRIQRALAGAGMVVNGRVRGLWVPA
jgi:hypothetical protein